MTKKQNNQETTTIRLNKLIARHGFCSRRKADEWIQAGRVAIDGIICREVGVQVDPLSQDIAVDGKELENAPPAYYILLNKPTGVITSRTDPQNRKTVLDLLPEQFVKAGVNPVGRLDYDSEGLIILTNDGDWSQILLHPRHQIWKEYIVKTDKAILPSHKKRLERGVLINAKLTLPSRVSMDQTDLSSQKRFSISIREGRNRQIRRMCSAIGLSVVALKRVKIGPIKMDSLEKGKWRHLLKTEINEILQIDVKMKRESDAT